MLLAYSGNEAYGQLITDSDKRLKTQKTDKKGGGFGLFKKRKGKSSSSGPLRQSNRTAAPRYSSGSPFASFNKRKSQSPRSASSERRNIFKNQRYTSPRYSSGGLASTMSGKKNPVRYSASKPPFSKRDKFVSPRYSRTDPFKQSVFARIFNASSGPRYSAGMPFSKRDRSVFPRYSAGSPFTKKQKYITPRYSAGSPFAKNFFEQIFSNKSGPRYSQSMPFTRKDKTVFPRYSAGSPYQKSFLERIFSPTPAVKYSAGSPFTRKQTTVYPRYSAGSPFSKKQRTVYPRYSAGSPFTNKQMNVTPRYSAGSPYQRGFFARLFNPQGVAPRYSADMPFTKRDRFVSPRYSQRGPEDQPFFEKLFARSFQPRYSQGSPYAQMNWNWIKPRYSTNKNRFKGNKRMQEQMRNYNEGTAQYHGTTKGKTKLGFAVYNLKTSARQKKYEGNKVPVYNPSSSRDASNFSGNFKRKWVDENKMHPSFKHNKINSDSEALRKGLRKWSVFWTRFNRNKVQPDAVTDKISKPKFDRKEAEIWNN